MKEMEAAKSASIFVISNCTYFFVISVNNF